MLTRYDLISRQIADKVGIVALARKLAIALWRFVEDGIVPDGATLKVRHAS